MKPNTLDYSVPREAMNSYKHPLRVGVGGPVGSGKTALLEALCKAMRDTAAGGGH